jgi:hypothetical protein
VEYYHQGRMVSPRLEDGVPGVAEVYEAEVTQSKYFSEEIKFLLRLNIRDPLARAELRKQDSRLLTLNPLVNAMGVLRAGGRLELSELRSFESKHPAILPSHDEAVEALIRKEHVQQLHARVNHTLSSLKKKFL